MRNKNETDFSISISSLLVEEFEKRRDKNYQYKKRNFANDLGIDYYAFVRYFNGERTPTLENLEKIRKGLDCSFDELLGQPKEYSVSDEEELIQDISRYTKLNKDVILNLHSLFDDRIVELINAILDADEYTFELLNKLYNYFSNQRLTGAFVFTDQEGDEKENKIVIDGFFDDFYDGVDGKLYLSRGRYERIKLENIMDSVDDIRKHSKYRLDYLVTIQKESKKRIKEIKQNKKLDDDTAASMLESESIRLSLVEKELAEVKDFMKEKRNKHGKK